MENIIFIPRFFSSPKEFMLFKKASQPNGKITWAVAAATAVPQGGTSHVTPSFLDIHLFWSLYSHFNVFATFPSGLL